MAAPKAAGARRGADVALFDATTLTAKGVKDQLVAHIFPTASIRLFTSNENPDSSLTEYGGEAMLVTAPDIDTLGNLDIAFYCGTRQDGERYLDWPRRAGFTAIDISGAAAGSGDAPLVNASVNPEAIRPGPGVIASPHSVAQMLSTLLAPIHRNAGLEEAVITVFEPASEHGQAGIDELYQQAVSLMNFQEMPKEVFGRQLAFNLAPGWLAEEAKRASATHGDLEKQVLRIIGGGFGLGIQIVQAPVFHGHAAMFYVVLRDGKSREDLLASFRQSEDIVVARRGDRTTPVERAGEAGLIVSGVQPGHRASSVWLWAVSDDLAGGRARNAVRIAETLIDPPARTRS